MAERKPIESWLTDMDGVLIHEGTPIPGADAFIKRLRDSGLPFLVLTNNSIYTARDLHARLKRMGLDVPVENIWTSALATAQFLDDQRPRGTAYVIGEAGLTTALHDIGYVLTDHEPDYVVLGETRTYSFEALTKAIRLINGGARFICTNPDETGPSAEGPLPATGSVAALITKATGKAPYFAGKPNPLMMRTGLNAIGAHSETSAMIGDRMDTDVLAGLEAGMQTFLVLTGLTTETDMDRYPFRPSTVVDSIADLVDLVDLPCRNPTGLQRMRGAAPRVNLPSGGLRCVHCPSRSVPRSRPVRYPFPRPRHWPPPRTTTDPARCRSARPVSPPAGVELGPRPAARAGRPVATPRPSRPRRASSRPTARASSPRPGSAPTPPPTTTRSG